MVFVLIFIVLLLGSIALIIVNLCDDYSYTNRVFRFNKGYIKHLRLPETIIDDFILMLFGTKKTKEYIEKEKEKI